MQPRYSQIQPRYSRDKAHRIAELLMDHFQTETSHQARSVILALALREIGQDNDDVKAFVLARLAADELPAAAAYTLAVLQQTGTFEANHAAAACCPPQRRKPRPSSPIRRLICAARIASKRKLSSC